MAIKIEIEAVSAAEMHQELATLLFGLGSNEKDFRKITAKKPITEGDDENQFREIKVKPSEGFGQQKADEPEAKVAEEPVKETPKKKRRTKAETETGKAAEVETAVEAVPEIHEEPEEVLNPAPAKETKVKKYSLDDTRQLIITKGSSKKAKIAAILGKHGVQTLPQLSEDQLQEVYSEIETL